MQWPVFYVRDRIKKEIKGHLLPKNLFASACSGHLLAKYLFGSACSGQYFMSEIELKRVYQSYAFSGHLLAKNLILLAVASIFITNMSGIRLPGEEEPLKIREPTLQISLRSNNLKRRIHKHRVKLL